MAVNTLYEQSGASSSLKSGSGKLKKIIIILLTLVGIGAIVFFTYGIVANMLGLQGNATLQADSYFGSATLFVNDENKGETPLEEIAVKSGLNKVVFQQNNINYEVSLKFLPNTTVVLTRDVGVSPTFSSGQNFWLEKSDANVLSVVSDPPEADVYIDDSLLGQTPYSTSDLSPGSYDLKVEKQGYEVQTSRIEINKDSKLNASVKLFPIPVPSKVYKLEGSEKIYDVYSSNPTVYSNTSDWVKGVVYWNKTRGINISDIGLNKDLVFGYYLDYLGNLYDAAGEAISVEDGAALIANADRGAYLRKEPDGEGFSEAAKQTYLEATGLEVASGTQVEILETGLGWLRVREEPSLDGAEVTTVTVGETYTVLDQTEDWVKIQVDETTQGWVSAEYTQEVISTTEN